LLLRILRVRNLLPNRQKKYAAESKTRQRQRDAMNHVRSRIAHVRDTQRWEEGGQSKYWSDCSGDEESVSDYSVTSKSSGKPTRLKFQEKEVPSIKIKNSYRKSVRLLYLEEDVSSTTRLVSSSGLWPIKTNFRKGTYSVGPSRKELVNFQRKQAIFSEIKSLLVFLDPMVHWVDCYNLLNELKGYVFKFLNTNTQSWLSGNQISLLCNINFLKEVYMSPSVTRKSSIRATPSNATFGYTDWTSCANAVTTRY